MGLIRRLRDFFVRKKMCSTVEPTAAILTAFDSPDFDIKLAEERIINNVIFKPFDKLILRQDIEYALTGHHPLNSPTVAAIQVNSTIEMLKEVEISTLSEIGFSTINNHEIRIGALTKYYSPAFTVGNKKSLYAYCKSCEEINEKEFKCEFQFFAADNLQISQIRKHILQDKKHDNLGMQNSQTKAARVVVLDEDTARGLDLKIFLTEKYTNAEVYHYTSYAQLLSDIADKDTPNKQQLPAEIDFIF